MTNSRTVRTANPRVARDRHVPIVFVIVFVFIAHPMRIGYALQLGHFGPADGLDICDSNLPPVLFVQACNERDTDLLNQIRLARG